MTMIFDEKSPYWCKNFEENKSFLMSQLIHFRNLYLAKGYAYLEYIYI